MNIEINNYSTEILRKKLVDWSKHIIKDKEKAILQSCCNQLSDTIIDYYGIILLNNYYDVHSNQPDLVYIFQTCTWRIGITKNKNLWLNKKPLNKYMIFPCCTTEGSEKVGHWFLLIYSHEETWILDSLGTNSYESNKSDITKFVGYVNYQQF